MVGIPPTGPVASRRLPPAINAVFTDKSYEGLPDALEGFLAEGELIKMGRPDGPAFKLWR